MIFLRNIALMLFAINALQAQESSSLEILNADFTYYDQDRYPNIRRLVGNVSFLHQGALMDCDSAWHYFKENRFEAYNNIHINKGDSIHLYGEKLDYDGSSQKAIVKKNIILKDNSMTLKTDEIHYFLESNKASYYSGATIINKENVLKSKKGDYLSEINLLIFKTDVTLENPNYIIECDTLHYNVKSETAYFYGPTTISADDNFIYCENGWYNTLTDKSQFKKNAYLWSDDQKLSGDTLFYDRKNGYGIAVHNVEIQDTVNDYSIFGNRAEYFEKLDSSIITDLPLLVANFDEDTLFLHSDTIIARLDSIGKRQIKAFTGAKFYSDNFQGKSTLLYYFMRDSTIQMFDEPILWSDAYQLSSEHITLQIKDNAIDRLNMIENAFIISKDSLDLFNQIKGKNMTGYFRDNALSKIHVKGNGQAVYVIKDEDDKLSGVNTVSCSEMNISVKNKELKRISFQKQPNATIFPLDELPSDWKRLKEFNERFDERIIDKEDIWE